MPARAHRAALASAMLVLTALSSGPASSAARADSVEVSNYVNSTVTITTNFGTIVAMLYDQGAPITTGNFLNLSTSGFYDGIKFHRIVDNFVIQTGDPNSKDNNPYNDGMGGSGTTIPLEINANLTHEDGAFGMARSSAPDSASSQFYICDGAQHQLDGNYSVFAITVQGIDVVRTIAQQPVWGYKRPLLKEHPIGDIVMTSVVASLGYWNNTTVPSQGGGGVLGAILAGPAGIGIAALLVAVAVGAVFVPPFRVRLTQVVKRVPVIARAGLARIRGFLPTKRARKA